MTTLNTTLNEPKLVAPRRTVMDAFNKTSWYIILHISIMVYNVSCMMYDVYYAIVYTILLLIDLFILFHLWSLYRFDQEPAIGFGTGTRPPLNNPSG